MHGSLFTAVADLPAFFLKKSPGLKKESWARTRIIKKGTCT